MKSLGLVTVLYHSDEVLNGFITSLKHQEYENWHIYFIDNSPSDEIDKLIGNLFKFDSEKYTHIKQKKNVGVAEGNNIGIKLAIKEGFDYILLLNNDIEFYQKNIFTILLNYATTHNEKIIVPKILYYNTRKIWMAGGKFQTLFARTPHLGKDKEDSIYYNQSKHVEYAPSCFMLINKKVFQDIGLMDEKYFVYYDDTDFVLRAKKNGYMIYYLPELEIFHKVSSSTGGRLSLFTIYYTHRNRIYYIRKHYSFFHFSFIYSICSFLYCYFIKYNLEQRKALLKGFKEGLTL
jgi:GT2 family glycosyltransferase